MKELLDGIQSIEDALKTEINDDPNFLIEELGHRQALLAITPRLKELSTWQYNNRKGVVSNLVRSDKSLLNLKQEAMRLYIAGEMADAEAIYEKTEKAIKSLELSIEGLRTMISFAGKQLQKSI